MEVGGALQETYEGSANYIVMDPTNTEVLSIGLTFEGSAGTATIGGIEGGARTGTFDIDVVTGPNTFTVTLQLDDIQALASGSGGVATLNDGTVTITSVGQRRVEGRFSGTGSIFGNTGGAVDVSGEFVAICQVAALCP